MTPTVRPAVPWRWTPALVGLAAALVSGVALWRPSAWFDEAATAVAVRLPPSGLVRLLGEVDLVHAVYYVVLVPWSWLAGTAPWALRVPSAVAVGVAAAGVVVLGRRLGSPRLGLLAGVVFLLLPRVTWMGTEARSSALVSALVVWWTVALLRALDRATPTAWAGYAVLGTLAVLVFAFAALVLVAHAVTLVWSRRGPPPRGWLVAGGWVLVVAAALGFLLTRQTAQVDWLPDVGRGTLRMVVLEQFAQGAVVLALLSWVLAGLGALLGWRSTDGRVGVTTLALPWLVLPPVGLVVASLAGQPYYTSRYVACTTAAFALLVAVPLTRLPSLRGRAWPAVAAIAVLGLLAAPAYVDQRRTVAKENSDWALVAQHLESSVQSGDVVLWGPLDVFPTDTRAIAASYPDAFADLRDPTRGTDPDGLWFPTRPVETTDLAGAGSVWVVRAVGEPLLDESADARTLEAAGFVRGPQWQGPGTVVTRFTGPAD